MRALAIVVAVALLSVPAAVPAAADHSPGLKNAPITDISAARKKAKKNKARIEYMRAVPVK